MNRLPGLVGAFAPECAVLLLFLFAGFWNLTLPEVTDVGEVMLLQSTHTAAGVLDPMLVQCPLFVWLLTLFEKIFGAGLGVIRTLSLFSATLSLAGVYSLALMTLKNRYAALTAGIVLATSAGFSGAATTHGPTMLMLALASFTCAAWLYWLSSATATRVVKWQLRQLALVIGVLISFVFLAGGIAGLFFVLAVIAALTLFSRQAPSLRQMPWRYLFIPVVIIALPWPLYLVTQHIGDISDAYAKSLVLFDPIRAGSRFMDTLINGIWPYFLFLLAALFEPRVMNRGRGGFDPLIVLVLSWLGAGILFGGPFHPVFTLLPPAALILGIYLGGVLEGQSGQRFAGLAADLTVLMLMLQAVAMSVLFYQEITDNHPLDLWHFPGPALVNEIFGVELFTTLAVWKLWLVPLPVLLLAGGLLMYVMSSSRRGQQSLPKSLPIVLMTVAALVMIYMKMFYWPLLERVDIRTMRGDIAQHNITPDRMLVDGTNPDLLKIIPPRGPQVPKEIRPFLGSDDLADQLKEKLPRHVWGIARERSYYDLPPEQRLRTQVMAARKEWHGFNIPDVTGIDLFGRRVPETIVLFRVLPYTPTLNIDEEEN